MIQYAPLDADLTPVDAYEIPAKLRELLRLRHPFCANPWGTGTWPHLQIDHSLSHLKDGPPGQTRLSNCLPLEVLPHRDKTHGGAQLRQPRPGTLVWQTPNGYVAMTDQYGTHNLGNDDFAHAIWRAAITLNAELTTTTTTSTDATSTSTDATNTSTENTTTVDGNVEPTTDAPSTENSTEQTPPATDVATGADRHNNNTSDNNTSDNNTSAAIPFDDIEHDDIECDHTPDDHLSCDDTCPHNYDEQAYTESPTPDRPDLDAEDAKWLTYWITNLEPPTFDDHDSIIDDDDILTAEYNWT